MNDQDIDRRLGELLRGEAVKPDPDFAGRVLALAQVERGLAAARRRAWRRLAIDGVVAAAIGFTFFLMSQEQPPGPEGMILLQGPAMAGLVMLALWGLVTVPASAGPVRGHALP